MPEQVSGALGTYVLDAASRREGGQAEVFRATGPDGRWAAVRLPRHGDAGWFARECDSIDDLVARLADARSWIVAIVDRGVAQDGRPFVVMPWYEMNLLEWLRTSPLLERRLEALEQASRAVARLHQGGARELDLLVHRDLKPSNFLVREEGATLSVVLTDLGAARAGALLATVPNTLIYTRNYAPPEQQLPVQLAPDPTVDVHALGVTIFVALAGRVPTAVLGREALRTPAAQRLLTLDALGGARSADEEVEFRTLAHRPLTVLLDLADAKPLFPGDEGVLRSRLADQLAGRCNDPEAVAARIAAKVLPALHRALEADPARRLGDARILQAACHHAIRILRQEGVIADEPGPTLPPPTDPSELPTPAWPVRVTGEPSVSSLFTSPSVAPAARRRGWVAALVGLLVLGGIGVGVGMSAPGEPVVVVPVPTPGVVDDTPEPVREDPPVEEPPVAPPRPVVPRVMPPGGDGDGERAEVMPSGDGGGTKPTGSMDEKKPTNRDRVEVVAPPNPVVTPPWTPSDPGSIWEPPAPPVIAIAPPRLRIQCRSTWTVRLDEKTVAGEAVLSEGTHDLEIWDDVPVQAWRLQVRRVGDQWSVTGSNWIRFDPVAGGGAVDLVCP